MNEMGLTSIDVKKANRSRVYQNIYQRKTTSKLQIVQDLRLGLSTVTTNLTILEEDGLISREGFFASTGGRKAQAIQIRPDYRVSVGVGILKGMYHVTVVDLYGDALCMETVQTPYRNTPEYYKQVADSVLQYVREKGYADEQVLGVSIATQGITSPDHKEVTYGNILKNTGMKAADFAAFLPWPCSLEHDSRSAAALELWNHPELDSAIVILLNQNLGGAVITEHRIHQGTDMHSGTIEHICVNQDGPLCYCGKRGCLETYCSADALKASAGMSIKEFFAVLGRRKKEESGNAVIGADEDTVRRAEQVWEDFLSHLAFAMRNLTMVVDAPFILSGYLTPYITEEDIRFLSGKINAASPFPMEKDRILVGVHGESTPAIGAALYYIRRFLKSV